jgi:UDP-2-acetamido-2-deoxy-ribo-hexuluronate aminotransferase
MEFVDLKRQYAEYKEEIDAEILSVLESAQFIRGPVVAELESELASYVGVRHAIGCSSGTDALLLALIVKGVQPGDEIIVPDFTFIATAEVVSFVGAKPVFADIDPDTYNIAPQSVEGLITARTKGVVAVSLFGQCADLDNVKQLARDRGIWVVEDAAQSFGATCAQGKSCALTEIATTSFFPAKPLGCYGDGGALFTDADEIAAALRVLLNHGQKERYRHSVIGINGRLDSIQAAILRVKIRHFEEELQRRREIASWYDAALKDMVVLPCIKKGNTSTWAQYSVRSKARDRIRDKLSKRSIPTAIHYPIPLHIQEAFRHAEHRWESKVTDSVCREIFSLPMHPFLTHSEVQEIAQVISESL